MFHATSIDAPQFNSAKEFILVKLPNEAIVKLQNRLATIVFLPASISVVRPVRAQGRREDISKLLTVNLLDFTLCLYRMTVWLKRKRVRTRRKNFSMKL